MHGWTLDPVMGLIQRMLRGVSVPHGDVASEAADWAGCRHRGGTAMEHYVGIDVSLEFSSVCVVDATGRVVREAKVRSDPEALVAFLAGLGVAVTRVGLEAGPLSHWLHAGVAAAGHETVLLETRHVKSALSAMVVKTDRRDARHRAAAAVGWYRPVHSKSLAAQEL